MNPPSDPKRVIPTNPFEDPIIEIPAIGAEEFPMPEMDEGEDNFMEEEETSYNFRELMDLLLEKKDIIITVPTEQVEVLKKGLYARKGRDTYKLSKAGVKAGSEVLSFLTYHPIDPATKEENKEHTCVRVKLSARKSVKVINLEVPDDSI